MAKGYPERKVDPAFPVLDDVIAEDVCIVCKRNAADSDHGLCSSCHAALHGD